MLNSKVFYEKGLVQHKSMVTQSQFSQCQFFVKLDNIKTFDTALKAVNFNQDANVIISEDGLKAVVEITISPKAPYFSIVSLGML